MEYATQTDRMLFIRTAAGDEQAFARLYQRYASRLTAFLYQRCGKNTVLAQDLLQQVFLQLLEGPAFRQPEAGPDRLDALLFGIAANVAKNHYRSQRRQYRHETVFLAADRATPDPFLERDTSSNVASSAQLQQELKGLPERQREVIQLCYQDGLTQQEVATLLNCPVGTVKSRLHHGLRKLAGILRPNRVSS